MFKKIIALSLILALLAPIGAVQAADNEAGTPTLEEILNEYHQKSFQEQATGISLCSNGKTLEEETVEALNNAGYEAYHVTGDNYDELEAQLQTDFSAMSLNRESAYIVTFGSNTRQAIDGSTISPNPDIWDGGGSGSDSGSSSGTGYFYYTYEGVPYKMRYAIVTSTSANEMVVHSMQAIQETDLLSFKVTSILEASLIAVVDGVSSTYTGYSFGTIISLLFDTPSDNAYTVLANNELVFIAESFWTLEYIQVWDSSSGKWHSAHSSEYVNSKAKCAGYIYDSTTNSSDWYEGSEHNVTIYSPNFFSSEYRKEVAMRGYNLNTLYADCVYQVDFILAEQDVEITSGMVNSAAFSHKRSFSILLPDTN